MKLSHSQPSFWAAAGCRRGPQQTGRHGLEVNASIEAVLVLSEITVGIFCKIERMIGSTQGGFQVTQQGINPVKAGHIGTAARSANHLGLMLAVHGRDGGKTRRTIRDHATLGRQMLPGPGADRLRAKALDPIKTHAHRTIRGIDLDRCNEGRLIFRAAPAFTSPLTAQVGIVGDHAPEACRVLVCVVWRLRELGGHHAGGDPRHDGHDADYRSGLWRQAVAGGACKLRVHERRNNDRCLFRPRPLGPEAVRDAVIADWIVCPSCHKQAHDCS